mgnify:CR=1
MYVIKIKTHFCVLHACYSELLNANDAPDIVQPEKFLLKVRSLTLKYGNVSV